jgi:hypothetical protein
MHSLFLVDENDMYINPLHKTIQNKILYQMYASPKVATCRNGCEECKGITIQKRPWTA